MAGVSKKVIVDALLAFFRTRCARPELIKDETSNVRYLCGYTDNLGGWRLLCDPISDDINVIASQGLWLLPTDMDGVSTIGEIAKKLRPASKLNIAAANTISEQRTGKAGFLAPRLVRRVASAFSLHVPDNQSKAKAARKNTVKSQKTPPASASGNAKVASDAENVN